MARQADKTVLSGVPRSMPSLLRAYQLAHGGRVGFDWKQATSPRQGRRRDRELREAVATRGEASAEAEEEFGDLLFSIVTSRES